MKKTLLLTLAIILCMSTASWAFIAAGTNELGINASIVSQDAADYQTIALTVGRFVTQELQVGGNLMYFNADVVKMYDILAQARYHLIKANQPLVPYAGGQIGLTIIDAGIIDDTSLSFGVLGGGKYFVSENTSANVELNLLQADDLKISLLFGYSIYFK